MAAAAASANFQFLRSKYINTATVVFCIAGREGRKNSCGDAREKGWPTLIPSISPQKTGLQFERGL